MDPLVLKIYPVLSLAYAVRNIVLTGEILANGVGDWNDDLWSGFQAPREVHMVEVGQEDCFGDILELLDGVEDVGWIREPIVTAVVDRDWDVHFRHVVDRRLVIAVVLLIGLGATVIVSLEEAGVDHLTEVDHVLD